MIQLHEVNRLVSEGALLMLLSFSIEGYKMYSERATISMMAAPKQKDLEYSLLRETVAGKERKGICSAVIYGPNAAGKSALVSAIRDFRIIVKRGSISAEDEGRDFALIPGSYDDQSKPVTFEVSFTKDNMLYSYMLMADLGRFGRPTDPRRVLAERLEANGRLVFIREGDNVSIEVHPTLESMYSKSYLENRAAADALLSATDSTDLFLDNGFRTVVSPILAKEVTAWFVEDLIVLDKANETYVHPTEPEDPTNQIGFHFTEAARLFGASSHSALTFLRRDESDAPAELYTGVGTPYGAIVLPSTKYESLGTMRFLNMLPFVEYALTGGKVLVMDELDASIHPMAVMSMVNAFHDDEVNVRHAQLIFTTHNPIFLDNNLFRRDEIKFVERDDETGESVTYALSDFGTSGQRGVRQSEDYQQKYFLGRYGAIRDIDLVPFLKEQVQYGAHMDIVSEGDGDSVGVGAIAEKAI